MSVLSVVINGKAREVSGGADGVTVQSLLGELGYGERQVAVAVNHAFVSKREHGSAVVRDGDEVEILAPMSGG